MHRDLKKRCNDTLHSSLYHEYQCNRWCKAFWVVSRLEKSYIMQVYFPFPVTFTAAWLMLFLSSWSPPIFSKEMLKMSENWQKSLLTQILFNHDKHFGIIHLPPLIDKFYILNRGTTWYLFYFYSVRKTCWPIMWMFRGDLDRSFTGVIIQLMGSSSVTITVVWLTRWRLLLICYLFPLPSIIFPHKSPLLC